MFQTFLNRSLQRKVPRISVQFWIVKVLTTAMGEALSDYLVFHNNPYIAVISGFFVFVLALIIQFYLKKYVSWVYWFAVSMVAVFGTMVADVIHVFFGIPYLISTIMFSIILIFVFIIWYKSEKTLSIHSIYNTQREIFYWTCVIVTFALGTACGDMTAATIGIGYFASGLLFIILILIPALMYYKFKFNPILLFWLSYILTRPLGASFADWIGKPVSVGGIGFGTGKLSIIIISLIIIFVIYFTVSKTDIEKSKAD